MNKDNSIIIAFSVDHNYVRHCASTIRSIIHNYTGALPIRFVITHDKCNFNDGDKRDLKMIVDNSDYSIEFFSVNTSWFEKMPVGGGTISNAITISTYYRIGFAKILPENIHKIIYLDSDIYVNSSIDELWMTDIEEYAIAGVPEPQCSNLEKLSRLDIPIGYRYINAGVLLMNLDTLREIDFFNKAIEYVRNNYTHIVYHDQDIINALLYDKICYLSIKYNMVDSYLYKKPPMEGTSLKECIKYQNTPSIIHYAGYIKPWHIECKNPYRKLYWEALRGTKWESAKKTFRQSSFIREFILILKLLLKKNPYFK